MKSDAVWLCEMLGVELASAAADLQFKVLTPPRDWLMSHVTRDPR